MDDALLVRVLNGVTDLDEQIEPRFGVQFLVNAVFRDRYAMRIV